MDIVYLFSGMIIGAFLVSIGLSLYLWKQGVEKQFNLAFSACGTFVTVFLFLNLFNYYSETVEQFNFIDKAIDYVIVSMGISFLFLLKALTGYRNKRNELILFVGFLFFTLTNAFTKFGVSFSTISRMEKMQLPFGVVLYTPIGETSIAQYVVIAVIFFLVYHAYNAFRSWNPDYSSEKTVVLWAVTIGVFSTAIDNILLLFDIQYFFFLDSAGYLFFVLLLMYHNMQKILFVTKLQDEIDEKERMKKLIVDVSNDGLWEWNLQTDKFVMNSRYATMLDYTVEEFAIGHENWLKLVHPDDRKVIMDGMNSFFASTLKEHTSEYRILSKKGHWVWTQNRVFVAATDSSGKPVHLVGAVTDVTERKTAEEKILQSENRFKTLSEATFEGIVLVRDGVIVDVNKQVTEMFGYDREDVLGRALQFLLHKSENGELFQYIVDAGKVPIEMTGIKKNGVVFPVEIRHRNIDQPDDGIHVCIIHDLSRQKKAESALLASEEKFRRLFEDSPIAKILVDVVDPYAIITMNTAGRNLLGIDTDHFGKLYITSYLNETVWEQLSKTESSVESVSLETKLTGTNHDDVYIKVNGGSISINGVQMILLHLENITAKMMAELRLNNSLAYIDRLINSLPISIISINRSLKVTLFNEASARFLDKSPAAGDIGLFEKFPKLLFAEEKILNALAEGEKSFHAIDYEKGAEKTLFSRHYFFNVIQLQFQLEPGYVIMIEEQTEKHNMEQMIIQSEKVMSVAGLAAGMAHELNNPLGTITQGCQNLVRRVSLDLPRNIRVAKQLGISMEMLHQYFIEREIFDVIDSMSVATQRAAEIIRSMLQFSRKHDPVKTPASMHDMIADALHLATNDFDLKTKFDIKRVSITRLFQEDLPRIHVNITEIEQVLLNIIKNALQAFGKMPYTPEAFEISFKTYTEEGFVCLDIQDNGPGMEKEVSGRIFEPFFTTKDIGEGTGLGLSVAYMIIQQNHGGLLMVDSKVGFGTRFSIKLPIMPIAVTSTDGNEVHIDLTNGKPL